MESRKFFAPIVVQDQGKPRTLLLDLVVPFRMKNDRLYGAWYDEREQKVYGSFVPISVWEFNTVPDILYALEMKVNTTHAILAERQRRMEHNRRILEAHKDGTRDVVVRLDVGDVSSLCHELAHVVDASNPTFGYKSESDEFKRILVELKPRLEQVYQILRDANYDFEMDLSIEHETYALQPDELFAVVVSDWFRRTHEPNVFADCQVPLLSEMVVDNLHQHPNWSHTLQTYCEQLTDWNRPCRSIVSDTKLSSSEDIERIAGAIDQLSDLKEKIL